MSLAAEETANSQALDLVVTVVLETQSQGKVSATTLEFPNCRVEAATREQALIDLQEELRLCLEKVELIPLKVRLPQNQLSENPWSQVVGVFSDDPDFARVQEYIQEYRRELDGEDGDTEPDMGRKVS
jgi:predicted RNase H-like HicB family nuclease